MTRTHYDYAASPITVPATGSQVAYGGRSLIMGWSLLETTGTAAATVEIWDGQDATGQLIAAISLDPGESTRDWLGPEGIETDIGLFVRVIGGSVRGAVWARLRGRAGRMSSAGRRDPSRLDLRDRDCHRQRGAGARSGLAIAGMSLAVMSTVATGFTGSVTLTPQLSYDGGVTWAGC